MSDRDYTDEATALFGGFAERHRLSYEVEGNAPVEVLWTFPVQEGLSCSIVLGLQNGDELNFGVADSWSYFFPYHQNAGKFDRILDAWMEGEARVAVTGRRGRVLQLRENGTWRSVYFANRVMPLWRKPLRTIENRPLACSI